MTTRRPRSIRFVDAALLGGIAAALAFIAIPADAATLVTTAANLEKPGLDENARNRAEANAQEAQRQCVLDRGNDRVALSTCIANARAAAYREQQSKANKDASEN